MMAAAVAMLILSTPAFAQMHQMPQHPQPAQRGQMPGMGDMQSCMDMMGGPTPGMILQHRQALGLSAPQVQRLQALQAQDSTGSMPHMREAMATHQAAAQLLRAEQPDFAAYEAGLREAANHAILGHVAMARSAVEAREVLTADQRTRLQTAMKTMGDGMTMSGMGGMMQGGGMMMDCPMMGGRPSATAHPAGQTHEH